MVPHALAQAVQLLPAIGNEHLTDLHVAGVLNRILVGCHQVFVASLPHNGDGTFLMADTPFCLTLVYSTTSQQIPANGHKNSAKP